jgi:ABC-type glycerol-3-phosphate transport system permease component
MEYSDQWTGIAIEPSTIVDHSRASAILGSVPIVILSVFFLDHYVSGLTAGAIT